MTKNSDNLQSERMTRWNSLSDTSNDKIKYLAMFDGDEEKAKWAFIRDGVKLERQTKFFAPKFFNMSEESSPTFAKKILSGNLPFWRSYVALIVVPNILFKVLLADQSLTLSGLKAALSVYYLLSIVAVILLTASAFKLHKEANKYAKIALGLMLLSVGSIVYQTPSVIDVFSANQHSSHSKNEEEHQHLFKSKKSIEDCVRAMSDYRPSFRNSSSYDWEKYYNAIGNCYE